MSAPAEPRLTLREITKSYGPVQALRGADFSVSAGEVHALLGENGAGKTTLMRIAAGLERADRGELLLDGVPTRLASPMAARRLGVGMVHQHFTSVPALTVSENLALAAGWPPAPRVRRANAGRLMERTGLVLDPELLVRRLTVGQKQRLEILMALTREPRILLLDEPTAVLAPAEVEEVLRITGRLRDQGGAVVLITHKLHEALSVANRVTVLRRGEVTLTGPAREQTPASLAGAMVGSAEVGDVLDSPTPIRPPAPGPELVRGQLLDLPRSGRGARWGVAVRGATFTIRGGEIVGIAAVEGNGQRELLRAVAGLVKPIRGRLDVAGVVSFIPEDRTTEGLIPLLSVAENIALGLERDASWARGGIIRWGRVRRRARQLIDDFGIRAGGPDAAAATLSGGNQQKVVIARALERAPRVIVTENPTRGLDLHATHEVHQRLRDAAADGAAVLLHSSDLDEVLALATRVLVMADGVLLEPQSVERSVVGATMLQQRRPSGVTGEHPPVESGA